MARRFLSYTERELEDMLANSDSDKTFELPDEGDFGWTDTEEPAELISTGFSNSSNLDTASSSNIRASAASGANSNKTDLDIGAIDSSDSVSESDVEQDGSPVAKRRQRPNIPSNIVWKNSDLDPVVHTFDNVDSGCKIQNLGTDCTPLDCFQVFFTQEITQHIAEQTNLYCKYTVDKGITDNSRVKHWVDTCSDEIYCFLAINVLVAQIKKNEINSYLTNDSLLRTPIFSQIMSRDRYLLLLRMLHFVDNNKPSEDDKMWKIRSIVDHVRKTFSEAFYPFQNLCIDESLLLFKGRLFFKQYIPSKRHRFGVKFFILSDCETGYVLDFIIYLGATTEIKTHTDVSGNIGKSGDIVLTLLEPYLKKGHTMYVDNWYTSPDLFSYLHDNTTNACGTVKKNRKNMPGLSRKLEIGSIAFMSTDKLLALKWQDKREVRMLSTLHSSEMVATGKVNRNTQEEIKKPKCIVNYNENMGAIDRSDMLLSSVECVRKTIKWYKKVFFHLVDLSLLNAHALYKTKTGKRIPILKFQLQVIKAILEIYHRPQTERRSGRRSADADNPMRLTERHFVSTVPPTKKKKTPQRQCVVCLKHGKRSDTRYMCKSCDVPLCLVICFERYHTHKYY